jgi:hypothetical protein
MEKEAKFKKRSMIKDGILKKINVVFYKRFKALKIFKEINKMKILIIILINKKKKNLMK